MIRLNPRWAALLLGCVASAGPLEGQSQSDRAALSRFRDSIAAAPLPGLLALEQSEIERARRDRDNPVLHLRLGILALRLHQLEPGRKHADAAGSEFQWAADLKPEWPWPWYGLGLVERLMPGQGRYGGGLFTMLGLDGETRAGKNQQRAMAVDSSFSEAVMELADLALDQKINSPLDAALTAARIATRDTSSNHDPEMYLVRGRLERVKGYPDSALVAFQRAQELGGSRDLLWLELARTIPLVKPSIRQWLGLPPEDSVYYWGAASEDSQVVALYRMDLLPILHPDTLVIFDSLASSARAEWLRHFWGQRDALALRKPGERLAEHFRRWDQARRDFPLTPFRRRYAAGLERYRSGNTDVDDRGVILVRQGNPTERIIWPTSPRQSRDTLARFAALSGMTYDSVIGVDQNGQNLTVQLDGTIRLGQSNLNQPAVSPNYGNESWVYRRPDGDLVLHFAANFDPQDYRLQSNILGLDVSFYEIIRTIDNGAHLPGIRRLLTASPAEVDVLAVEERVRARRDNLAATTTDTWVREYPRRLPGRADWFFLGVKEGQPLAHLIYTLDAAVVNEQPWPLVPLEFRAAFIDPDGGVFTTLDSTLKVAHAPRGRNVIGVHLPIPLPTGVIRSRLGVELTPDIGLVGRLDTLRVPDFSGRRLSVSDLLIGRRGESIPWEMTPGDTIWIDPRMTYRPDETLQITAEIHGIQPGEEYEVQLALTKASTGLRKLLGGRSGTIILSEKLSWQMGTGSYRRSLSLAPSGVGDFELKLTVIGKSGKAETQRRVYVAETR